MGGEVVGLARDREDVTVVGAVNRDPGTDAVHGVRVRPATEFAAVLRTDDPDVVVDFTGPESTAAYAATAAEHGVAFVTGTTGLADEHDTALDRAAATVPVLHAANFSRGIEALRSAVSAVVADLPEYDVELIETHHAGKRDAPSGTAGDLIEAVDAARDGASDDGSRRVHGRSGLAPRTDGEIGVHAVRAGNITGEHVIVLAGNHEQVRLEHRAGDRSAFAAGALDAAEWVVGRDPGRYDLAEVSR